MREKLLSGLIALQEVSRAAADVQFIDFWKTADAFSASVFEDIDDVGGKKYAQSFSNRYERVKRAMSLYQDFGPCDSAFTNPTYELVEMKEYNRRNAVATNIENLADMLDDWMNSYACVAAHDRVSGKKIRVPRRSVVDMRSLGIRPEFQPREYAYLISSNTMDYDEALASCYLQGMYLANPDGDKNRLGSLREALDVNQRYWFEGDTSCNSITGEGVVRTENCQDKFHAVCQSGHFTDKCYVGSYKTCTSLGDPHYITFDGEFHHFQGSCEYTMVEVDTVQYPNFPWFRVRADLAAFSVGSPFTWNRGFVFEFMGEDQEEGDEPRYTINADGWKWQMRGMVLEDKELGVFHTEDHFGNPDFQLSTSNNYVSITTWFGVTVSYQAGLQLKIKLPDCYIDNVDGLCGNWDGVQYDEFAQIESSFAANWRAYQSGLTEWAEQFEVPDERCREIHDFECNIDLVTATDHCLPLDPNNLEGVFSTCNIDRTPYHIACMIDVCERESTRCASLRQYAEACINDLAPEERGEVCSWENELGCEGSCPWWLDTVWNTCADTCAARKTCENRHLTDFERCGVDFLTPEIDGRCVCEPGFIRERSKCIPEAECGCTITSGIFSGYYLRLGASRSSYDDRYECTPTGLIVTPIPCEEKRKGYCKVHSDPWIETFDNYDYGFHGNCRYNLVTVEDTLEQPGFSIDIKNRRREDWGPDWDRSGSRHGSVVDEVWISFHSSSYTFGDERRYSIYMNNMDNSNNYRLFDPVVLVQDHETGLEYTTSQIIPDPSVRDIAMEVEDTEISISFWNSITVRFRYYYWTLEVFVPPCYKDVTTGLCGNWNDDSSDEEQIELDLQADAHALGERFVTEKDDVCNHGGWLEPCANLTATEFEDARERCAVLKDGTAVSSIFRHCSGIDKQPFFDACLFNTCIQDDFACGHINEFAQTCLATKHPSLWYYDEICSWPEVSNCAEDCPGGQIYKGCSTTCIEARTCDDVVDEITNLERCGEELVREPMCGCPLGQVWHGNECIDEDECPRDCPSTGTGQCRAWGDPHYTTFDGGQHHFQGRCKYTFIESDGNDEFRNMPAFRIEVDQEQCGAPSSAVSCIDGWTFEFPGRNQDPDETPRYMITLVETNMVLEDRVAGRNYRNWWNGNEDVLSFRFHCGVHHMVRTWFGASIDFYYRSDDLRVTLPDCYRNSVAGLCGNWNGVAYDEFSRMQGLDNWRDHQTELVAWANDFAEPDPRCREVHDFECDDIDAVTDLCVELDKNIPGGVFHECTVDKDDFYLACLIDTCQDRSTLCSTYKAYASECLNSIAAHIRPQVCTWANELGCEDECGENMVFEGCTNVCSATKTCADRHLTDAERCGARIDEIDSVCVCEAGYVFDGDDCILEADCGCVWDYNNVYYSQGSSFNNEDERCECTSSGVVCTPIPCHEKSWRDCRAHNDPYIATFDGPWLGFHGDCRYNLARAEDTAEIPGFNFDSKNRRPWLPFGGAVTDEIWFDFHSRDYTFGDAYRYTLHVRNLDDSSSSSNANFEFSVTDNSSGEQIDVGHFYYTHPDFTLRLSHNWDLQTTTVFIETATASVEFKSSSWTAKISVSDCYKNTLDGLCGNFNDNNAEELMKIRDYRADSDAFGERFVTEDDGTCSHGDRLAPCEDLSVADYSEAAQRCDALRQRPLNSASRSVFAGCEFLGDRTPTYEACLFNSCVQDDLHCGIMEQYASDCLARKDPLSADYARICNWASATGCEEECPVGQIYKGCTSICIEQRTCDDVVDGISNADRCGVELATAPACGCPDGQVWHNEECIDENECPRDCDISQTTQCRAWGDPHYTTFDGGHHHFQGACKYTFVESAGNEDFRNSPAFKIDVDQRLCGNAVSCIRGWTFEFPGQDQGPNETPRYIITLEGTSMVLEDRFEGNSFNRWWNGNADVLEFKFHCGYHHIVRTWFGLRIDYYYRSADLRVSVPNCFMNHVTGLCGNWNGVSYDEFSRLQGVPGWRDHQTELVAWANDFAEPDPRCREVHDLECDDLDAVTDMCVPLDKNIPGGAFHECTVDKDDVYLACLVDTCQDRSALCSTFKAYATECLNNIAAHLRPQICTWANELGCEETCGANMNYEGCANVCSATKTCMDRHLADAERCGATINDIDSLCVCQPGFIFDGEDCILEADCGCVWDFNNVYYSQGESFNNADERCECTAAGIVCTPIPCDEKRMGYCYVHNDPYIRSFDGPQLGFHGDCRYNLARAEDTLEMPGFNVDAKNRRPWLPFAGAVTDEIYFDFHGENYAFGDTYKYSLHVRNLDTSSRYLNSRFEITLMNNHDGNKIYDAVHLLDREDIDVDGFRMTAISLHHGLYPRIYFDTEFVRLVYHFRSWTAIVHVSDCYRNKLSGLCGNFDGNNAEELDNIRQYALDSDAFGDEFETENDGTCSHGDRLTPCEDLSAAEYNEAANRCDALRQSPMILANRIIFRGCEFLGDRTPTHEACLFNSCVQDDLHCGIMADYASQCLERKDPLSADYARICNWASATGCEEECQADQVFKGCGNVCHEQQTCEDHVRGISRDDRCDGSTFNLIEAMCGCPEGHVLEGGTCVAEISCGCLTDTDEYVEQGSDISTETEICTCGSNGELTCEPLNCPCDDQLFCVNLVCDAPRDFVGGPEGIVGTFQVTRNYELGYEFTCDYPISDGGFSAGEHIGPHIFDGDMSRMQESFRGVSTDNKERMSRKMARSWGNAGNMWFFHSRRTLNRAHIGHEKEHGSYTVDLLNNACVPGFNSIRITQEHDAETDAITKRFFFNGVLTSTKFYASSTNMYLGELTASLAFVGEEFGVPPGQIRNFYFRDTERTTFVGAIPQIATGGNVLMDIDLNKSFVVHFELDCAAPFTDGHVLDIREQNIARISMQQPDEDPRITLSDKPFMSFSRSSIQSFELITMAYGDGETITDPVNFPFLAGPRTQTGFQGDFNYKVLMSWMDGCPVPAADNWTTFLFEHIFDENTGLWTNRWSANGIPVVAVSYSIQNFPGNYQLGFTNNPAGGFISSTALRNFWYKEV